MKTLNIIALVLLTATVILSGCGKDPVSPSSAPEANSNPGPDSQQIVDARLVGMWMFTSATVDGTGVRLGHVLEWEPTTTSAACQIDADGGYLYAEFDSDVDVTYHTSGQITSAGASFSIQSDGMSFSGKWAVSGTQLTLRTTIDGSVVILTAENLGSARSLSSMIR